MNRKLLSALTLGVAASLALAGCSASAGTTDATAAASDGSWPRSIEHVEGTTEITAQPVNIVSTSPTLTGTLLAIGAPVTATATTTVSDITDENGFFSQWADVATDRGVEELYPNLEFDEESVLAADPDLIVVSATGADSTIDQYDKLSKIAPTIVLNYGETTWQDIAEQLGVATGHEEGAESVIANFDAHVDEVAAKITVPAGTANAIVWNGTENPTAFAKPGGSHADLLDALGFTIEGAADEFDTSEQARQDFAFLAIENVTTALTGDVVFVVTGTEETAADLAATPVLATAPAVVSGQIVPLGAASFRIDYYSGTQIIELVEAAFA